MNNTNIDDLLKSRRSIKNYLNKDISDKDLLELVSSSSFSPSPANSEPVRFVNLNSDEVRSRLKDALYNGKEELILRLEKRGGHCCGMMDRKILSHIESAFNSTLFMLDAPLLMAVCIKNNDSFMHQLYNAGITELNKTIEKSTSITAGAYLQSFMLKAAEKGIGTCILDTPLAFMENQVGFINNPDLELLCFITGGYFSELPDQLNRMSADELLINYSAG